MEIQQKTENETEILIRIQYFYEEVINYIYSSLLDIKTFLSSMISAGSNINNIKEGEECQKSINTIINEIKSKFFNELKPNQKKNKILYKSKFVNLYFQELFKDENEGENFYYPFYFLSYIIRIINHHIICLYEIFNKKIKLCDLKSEDIDKNLISVVLRCVIFIEMFSLYYQLKTNNLKIKENKETEILLNYFTSLNGNNNFSKKLLNNLNEEERKKVFGLSLMSYKIVKLFLFNNFENNNNSPENILSQLINFSLLSYKDGIKTLIKESKLDKKLLIKLIKYRDKDYNYDTLEMIFNEIKNNIDENMINDKEITDILNKKNNIKDFRGNNEENININNSKNDILINKNNSSAGSSINSDNYLTSNNNININKKEDNKEDIINKLKNDIITLKNEVYFKLNNELEFSQIRNDFNQLEILEKLNIDLFFNSNIIDLERKKVQYLEYNINLLKNTDSFIFHIWKKVSSIILKNIFIFLKKEGYTFSYKTKYFLLIELKNYKSKIKNENQLKLIEEKIITIENELKNSIQKIEENSPTLKERRNTNLIIILKNHSPDIIENLSIEFLFYLKESGKNININISHFNEEILNIFIFDNININNKRIIKFERSDLIDILKNPLNFNHEKMIEKLEEPIYNKIKEIKNGIKYTPKGAHINELNEKINKIEKQNNILYEKYKIFLCQNNININNIDNIKNNANIDIFIKDNLKLFIQIKELNEKILEKKRLYEYINKQIKELNDIKISEEKKLQNIVKNINNRNQIESKDINIYSIFEIFKKEFIAKIKNEKESLEYPNIFSVNIINNFKIEDFFKFIEIHTSPELDFLT